MDLCIVNIIKFIREFLESLKFREKGEKMLKELTIKDFMSELSSSAPVPGGGGVAALGAALSCALTSMVFNLTTNKKAFNNYEEDVKVKITKALEAANMNMNDFLDFMDKDAEEFLSLMSAFKLPKNSNEEKKIREESINTGYLNALNVPLEMAERAVNVYDYINIAAAFGNRNAVSDAGVAALMLQSSIESAILNVNINLASIKDEQYRIEISKRCENIIEIGEKKKKAIMDIVNSSINA